MRISTLVREFSLTTFAAAKQCINTTVPVSISARNSDFNINIPETNLDATTFIQNLTRPGGNFTNTAVSGYLTFKGRYNISTQFCYPDSGVGSNTTVQVLTHGVGFDKTYWDLSFNDYNYSYVNNAVEKYGYCTLSYDRLGTANSSLGNPLEEIQVFLEISSLHAMTQMLRQGNFPGVNTTFSKVVHVGHSFGSTQTYSLTSMYPQDSDAIVLTGFSRNARFHSYFPIAGAYQQAVFNDPERFINYPLGYLLNPNAQTLQYQFFLPGHFDPAILDLANNIKQPVTVGELLTIGSVPTNSSFGGPVLIITGSADVPFCGGNCSATGDPDIPSVPAEAVSNFPDASSFEAVIAPNTGHGINLHYNATAQYDIINSWFDSHVGNGGT